jgi:hypothetical protein
MSLMELSPMEERSRTPHIVAIGLIWGFATAMLAICIPLVSITRSGAILPLSVILGVVIGTVVIWRSPTHLRQVIPVEGLEQRIATLETVNRDRFDISELKQPALKSGEH